MILYAVTKYALCIVVDSAVALLEGLSYWCDKLTVFLACRKRNRERNLYSDLFIHPSNPTGSLLEYNFPSLSAFLQFGVGYSSLKNPTPSTFDAR